MRRTLLALSLVAAVPAAAQTPAKADEPRIVCKLESETGRLTKRKVCRAVGGGTDRQNAERRSADEFRADLQRNMAQGYTPLLTGGYTVTRTD